MLTVEMTIQQNLVGAMGGHRHDQETPTQFARRMRPNAFEALALFESDWRGRLVEGPGSGTLLLIVMIDHVGTSRPSRRMMQARNGWQAVIHLDRRFLMLDGRERPIGAIVEALEGQAQDILTRLSYVPRDGLGHGAR